MVENSSAKSEKTEGMKRQASLLMGAVMSLLLCILFANFYRPFLSDSLHHLAQDNWKHLRTFAWGDLSVAVFSILALKAKSVWLRPYADGLASRILSTLLVSAAAVWLLYFLVKEFDYKPLIVGIGLGFVVRILPLYFRNEDRIEFRKTHMLPWALEILAWFCGWMVGAFIFYESGDQPSYLGQAALFGLVYGFITIFRSWELVMSYRR